MTPDAGSTGRRIGVDTRGEMEITIGAGILEIKGTEDELRAEGLIPANITLQDGRRLPIFRWEAGGQRFTLRVRADHCLLLVELAGACELHWAIERLRKLRRIAAEQQTFEGVRLRAEIRLRAAAAAKDPAWLRFKAAIPGLSSTSSRPEKGRQ